MKQNQKNMKFIIGLVAALMITGSAFAQHGNSSEGHVNFGIKGGLNVYNVHNDNGVNYDAKLGFNIGLLGHIHIARQFAIQPEVLFSSQGAKYTNVNGSISRYNLNYINVPVMVQYMWDNGFRIEAGPQAGFMVSAKTETNDVTVNNSDNVKHIDLGVGVGLGYVHPATGLGIDARYNLGLSNINENSDVKSTNRGFQVGLFYIFGHDAKKAMEGK